MPSEPTRIPSDRHRRVVAVAYDGLCAFEFGVATELFGLARPELALPWYAFRVVAAEPGPLRALGGVELAAPHDLEAIAGAGTVVLPGWRDADEPPPPALVEAIASAHACGARILSICSGVFLLAATGLLDDRRATTHWRYTERLARRHPRIAVEPDVLYVDNGSLLTSAGSAAGIDLGLHLIRRDYGAAIANRVARRLVVPPHRDGGQAQFIDHAVPEADETGRLRATLEWALAHLAEPLPVDVLARRAGLSPRTFARRFRDEIGTTPHRWLVHQRIARAQELLETTGASIDEVATQSGFATATNLRHHFRREVRTTPTRYRARFQRAAS